MTIAILLIVSIVLLSQVKPKDAESYRKVTMAIIGFAYFIVWRFVQYLSEIHYWEESTRFQSYLVIGIVATLICVLPVVKNISRTPSIAVACTFIVLVIAMFALESPIKFRLAVITGYFDQAKLQLSKFTINDKVTGFSHKHAGYSFKLPQHWTIKQDKGQYHPYFVFMQNNTLLAEFRPRCFFGVDVPLPTIVNRLTSSNQNTHCSQTKEESYTCLVKTNSTKQKNERWRYLVKNKEIKQGAELDFVFFDKSKTLKVDAEKIISSLVFDTNFSSEIMPCLSVAEWL